MTDPTAALVAQLRVIPPYQERVVLERAELAAKLERLNVFLAARGVQVRVGPVEYDRLLRQRAAMRKYLKILDERIAAWGEKV